MSGPFDVLLQPAEKKNVHSAGLGLTERSGRYRIGPSARPVIAHDNGHLDRFAKREPTAADYAALTKWIAMLMASEKFRKDLSDANAAYRHFLYGKGKDRKVDYHRYLKGDPAGGRMVMEIINDFRKHAEIIGKDRLKFAVTSEPYAIGDAGFALGRDTENWQKTIGQHYVWVSANVDVSADEKGKIWYAAELILNMEDRYNFNPGNKDIATGIPDADNGRFEITGLAHQYMSFGSAMQRSKWLEGERQ
jgi:hypothetical protein